MTHETALARAAAAEIRAAYGDANGVTQAALAEQYSVSISLVCMVIRDRLR